jgi:hypothetical protein
MSLSAFRTIASAALLYHGPVMKSRPDEHAHLVREDHDGACSCGIWPDAG